MTERLIISGTRRAMKELVDGTIRVSIDVDPEFRDDFFRLFGSIDMAVALAPLAGAASLPAKNTASDSVRGEHWKNLGPLAQSAILICKEDSFQRFVAEKTGAEKFDEDHAAEYVKDRCLVASRRDLDTSDGGRTRLGALMAEYREWCL